MLRVLGKVLCPLYHFVMFRSKHSGVKGIVFGVNDVIFHCLNEGFGNLVCAFVYIRVPKDQKADLLLSSSSS